MEGIHTLLAHYCDRATRDKGHTVEIIYRMALPAGEHTPEVKILQQWLPGRIDTTEERVLNYLQHRGYT